MDIKKRVEELTEIINYHNHKYYVEDDHDIDDYDYDILMNEPYGYRKNLSRI